MPGGSISPLAWKVTLDAAKLVEGGKLSKDTFKALSSASKETKTDLQKLSEFEQILAAEVKKGALEFDHAKKAVDAYKSSLPTVIEETRKLNEEMKKTRGQRIAEKVEKLPILGHLGGDIGKGVDMFSGGLGPTAIVGSAVAAGKVAMGEFMHQAEKIDQVGKGATKLGIATEAYLTLSAAAKRVDVDVNDVAAAFAKMNRNIGEAVAGGKPQQEALARLGLNYRELATLKPEQAFLKISDALRNTTDPYARASIGADIFGKSAANLNEVLRMGSKEFGELHDKLARSGKLFSAEQAEQVDRAAKAYERMGASWEVLKTKATLLAAPELEKVFNRINSVTSTDTGIGIGERLSSAAKLSSKATWLLGLPGVGKMIESALPGDKVKQGEGAPEDKPATAFEIAAAEGRKEAEEQAKKAAEHAARAKKEHEESVQKYIDKLKLEAATIGQSSEASARAKAEAAGLTGATLEQALALERQIDTQKRQVEERKKAATQVEQMRKQAQDTIRQLEQEAAVAGLPTRERAIALERLRAIEKGAPKELADKVAALKREAQVREEIHKLNEASLGPAAKYGEKIRELQEGLNKGLNPVAFMEGMDKAKKDLLSGLGVNLEQLKKPAQKYAEEMRAIDKAHKAGAISLKEMTDLKQRAQREFDKPLVLHMKDSGIEATTDAATAMHRVDSYRKMLGGQKQEQADRMAAAQKLEAEDQAKAAQVEQITRRRFNGELTEEAGNVRRMAAGAMSLDQMAEAAGNAAKQGESGLMPRLVGTLERLERNSLVLVEGGQK